MSRIAVLLLWFGAANAYGQVALLQIQVVEGESTVHQPGARSSRPLIVQITDETAKPIAGAAVSFHLPEDGPGGTFASGLRTDVAVTDARGRAGIHAFQANRIPGQFEIRIIASKEQARAGTISVQYISELKSGGTGKTVATSHSRRWIAIAALIGGGTAGAVFATHGSSTAPAAVPAAAAPVFSIGAPNISVGKP